MTNFEKIQLWPQRIWYTHYKSIHMLIKGVFSSFLLSPHHICVIHEFTILFHSLAPRGKTFILYKNTIRNSNGSWNIWMESVWANESIKYLPLKSILTVVEVNLNEERYIVWHFMYDWFGKKSYSGYNEYRAHTTDLIICWLKEEFFLTF